MGTTVNKGWKVTCAALVIVNVVTLHFLFDTRDALSDSDDWLADYKFSEAMRDAGADFTAGRLRVYEIETQDCPAVGQPLYKLKSTFTGRKDGPVEIWTYPRFRQDPREDFRLRLASEYVSTYNQRMRLVPVASPSQTGAEPH